MTKLVRCIGVFCMFFIGTAVAGTILKFQSEDGMTTVLSDGRQARMNTSGGEYIIIDYGNRPVRVVSPAERQVMLMDIDDTPARKPVRKVNTELRQQGAGGSIAGYPTQKYAFIANGKPCGVVYASKKAYQVKEVRDLFNAMQRVMNEQQGAMGGFSGMIDDCTLGQMQMSDRAAEFGLPMRVVQNGTVEYEVKSLQLNASVPADSFAVPADYRTVSLKEQMRMADRQISAQQQRGRQAQPMPPEVQQMIKQMQQSGEIPPDVLKMMRQGQ